MFYRVTRIVFGGLLLTFAASSAFAQSAGESDSEDAKEIEEVVVVGSQIKGASISDALSVSVLTSTDIEALGVDSGDELLDMMAEQGSNYFNESQTIGGGVNGARGDVGAFNLRNLGTGNTLVLLNGRRVVNMANYQTEQVGGSFVPVNSANSNSLPLAALERVEVLRDGASAIYGADAVAGVVNYVTKTDYDGLRFEAKYSDYESLPRNDLDLTVEWGKNFNDDRTNISVFLNAYDRDPVNAQDDPKWADTDGMQDLLPGGVDNPWYGSFLNGSAHSSYGQYDIIQSISGMGLGPWMDTAGEFETYPTGDARCQYELAPGTCGAIDGQGTYRHNLNSNRDLYSDLQRYNAFVFLTHDFGNDLESFTELSAYQSRTVTYRQASMKLAAVASHIIPADNYYNPFGPCTSPNRIATLPATVPCEGLAMTFDNYRWTQVPRIVDNDGDDFRFLTGLRGVIGEWDWEGAVSWSRSEKEDITHNRFSNTLLQEGLNDTTATAINPFAGDDPVASNISRALIDVYRKNQTELQTIDFKMSTNELFNVPAGPVGIVAGVEFRTESFEDNRDPRLDGQIVFTDTAGSTFPDISDVMNSSPSADSGGDRDIASVFGELQVPVLSNLDLQLAMRYEDYSDVGDTTVGKVAFGWRIIEPILIRGSWSEAFRIPNLITVNEGDFTRSNTNFDFVCLYADPNEVTLDCSYAMLRSAGGSEDLVPEESDNTSIGIVVDVNEHLTLTLDHWSIKKKDTIGLFGEENHTALDLLRLIEAGTGNCANPEGNDRVEREPASTLSPDEALLFTNAGICPVGDVTIVNDSYANLDERTVKGHDIGVYFNYEFGFGDIDVRYVGSFLDEYEQVPGPAATALFEAQDAGILPPDINIEGFGNLIRHDSNVRQKQTLRVSWRRNDWGAAISGTYLSDFWQTSLTLPDGTKYIVPSMQTWNTSADYRFDAFGETRARVRLGIQNVFDERAPLYDDSFAYAEDVHRDLGRSYYVDLRLDF